MDGHDIGDKDVIGKTVENDDGEYEGESDGRIVGALVG